MTESKKTQAEIYDDIMTQTLKTLRPVFEDYPSPSPLMFRWLHQMAALYAEKSHDRGEIMKVQRHGGK